MSIQKNKLFIRMSKILLLLTAVYAMVAYSAASNNAKNKELIIHVDPSTHCI